MPPPRNGNPSEGQVPMIARTTRRVLRPSTSCLVKAVITGAVRVELLCRYCSHDFSLL